MKANSPRSSQLHRAVSKKQFLVRTACATRLRPLLLWLLLTLPAVVQAQFNYTIDNGTITITGYTGPGGAVAIPDTIIGLPVSRIGYGAFSFNASLTSVTIPNTVTTIGDQAFDSCTNLASIIIPESVTSIGYGAFAFNASLTSISIPNSVTSIGYGAFERCTSLSAIAVDALNSVYSSVDGVLFNKSHTLLIQFPGGKAGSYTIPSSVTNIGYSAFVQCTSLTNVTIPNSVTDIGDYAFYSCTGLTSVTLGNSVTSIGSFAFGSCTSLTSVTIPNSVTSIGAAAFVRCTSLTSISIPKNVIFIGSSTLGNGEVEIWNGAFSQCTSLSAITVDALNSVYSSVDGVLFNKSQTVLIKCPGGKAGNYTIPSSVTSIEYYAFHSCISLTSVTLPNSVTTIGANAFFECTSLTSVTLGNSVTSIRYWAFAYCTSLTSITLPNSVTTIGEGAFAGCTSLSAITVDALNSFYRSVDGVLFNKSQTLLVQYPGGKAGSYTIPDSVTSIGEWAFAGCISLTSVTLPNSVTSIGEGAFAGCTSLTSVTIPNSVASIGNEAFSYCTSLTGVYFQGNAPVVYEYWFSAGVFGGSDNATVYHLPGTTGWGTWVASAVLWNPLVDTSDPSFGVRTNRFGFTITGASNLVIVVEASTDLANPAWVPVGTNTLTGGSYYFSDPEWTNHPARFYRLRSP